MSHHDIPVHERIDALSTRVRSVEEWMEGFKLQMTDAVNEVRANTRLTEDIHGKTEAMYEVFETTRNGIRMVAAMGNFGFRVIETAGKVAKPLLLVGALLAAISLYFKTGEWRWP